MKLERIVVGIDFSRPSVQAAEWTASQFAPGAEFILTHAIAVPDASAIVRSGSPRRDLMVETLREGADKRLRELGISLGAKRMWIEIREGDPSHCLAEVADSYSADLIISGTHGERPGVREELGSTAERLVNTARVPVLLVARPGATPPGHILAAVDNPHVSAVELGWAAALSREFGARVTAVHVITSAMANAALTAAAMVSGAPPVDLQNPQVIAEETARWLKETTAAGVPSDLARCEVMYGDPAAELLRAVERLGADLLIMGRRSAGGLRRAVMGSVVAATLRRAPCPVLVTLEPPESPD